MRLDRINEALCRLKQAQEALAESSEEMQRRIVSGDAQEVGKQVKAQQEQLSALNRAEEERRQAVEEWATEQGIPPEEATVSRIVELTEGGEAERLMSLSRELTETIERQRRLNMENRSLLELHFQYMDFLVNNFLEEPQLNNIYGSTGELAEELPVNRIDGEA